MKASDATSRSSLTPSPIVAQNKPPRSSSLFVRTSDLEESTTKIRMNELEQDRLSSCGFKIETDSLPNGLSATPKTTCSSKSTISTPNSKASPVARIILNRKMSDRSQKFEARKNELGLTGIKPDRHPELMPVERIHDTEVLYNCIKEKDLIIQQQMQVIIKLTMELESRNSSSNPEDSSLDSTMNHSSGSEEFISDEELFTGDGYGSATLSSTPTRTPEHMSRV